MGGAPYCESPESVCLPGGSILDTFFNRIFLSYDGKSVQLYIFRKEIMYEIQVALQIPTKTNFLRKYKTEYSFYFTVWWNA